MAGTLSSPFLASAGLVRATGRLQASRALALRATAGSRPSAQPRELEQLALLGQGRPLTPLCGRAGQSDPIDPVCPA